MEWVTNMHGVGTTHRTQHITEILLKTGSALEEVFQYYKVGRHESTFTGKSYFLLSHCAHLLFSLRSADQDSGGALFQHASGPAAFLAELDYGPLRHADYKRRTHHADSLDDHLKNEPKWFDFWMGLLERLDPREEQGHREFTKRVLTYVGYRGFLEGKAVRKNKKILDDLMKTMTAGRILLRTMAVLEDMIRVITSHFATQDPKTCMDGQVTALACLLNQIRRTIVWEAPATGPYVPRGAKSWKMPMSLARLHLGATEGTLRLVPKREGGEIICSYHWMSKSARKRRSWTIKTSMLKRTYEQELFATWARETGKYADDPGRFPEASASWNVQNAEADRIENLSRQADLVLNALRANRASRGLVAAVTPILRNGATRWKATELSWTYIRQLEKLLNKLTFACREAKVLGGENPAEQVVRQIWPSQISMKVEARREPKPPQPSETTTDESPAEATTEKCSLPGQMTRIEQNRPEEGPAEMPQPSSDETMATENLQPQPAVQEDQRSRAESHERRPEPQAELLEPDEPQEPAHAEDRNVPGEPALAADDSQEHDRPAPPTQEPPEPSSSELPLCIPPVEEAVNWDADAPVPQDASAPDDADAPPQVTAPPTSPTSEDPEATATDSSELPSRIPTVEEVPGCDADTALSQDASAVDDADTPAQVTAPSTSPTSEEPEPTPHAEQPAEPVEIDLFSAMIPAPQEDSEQQPACGPTKPKEQSADADDAVLLQRLQEHHRPPYGAAEYKPLSLVQLTSDLAWNRTRVQRTMTALFGPKPFSAYKECCKDRTIADFLNQLPADGTETLIAPTCTTA